jgi:hypothetical protein
LRLTGLDDPYIRLTAPIVVLDKARLTFPALRRSVPAVAVQPGSCGLSSAVTELRPKCFALTGLSRYAFDAEG